MRNKEIAQEKVNKAEQEMEDLLVQAVLDGKIVPLEFSTLVH